MSDAEMNRDFLQLHKLGEYQSAPTPERYTDDQKRVHNLIALALQRRQYAERAEFIPGPPATPGGFGPPVFLPGVRVETTWKQKENAAERLHTAVIAFLTAEHNVSTNHGSENSLKRRERALAALTNAEASFNRCKREHQQARGDFAASTTKPNDEPVTYYVRMHGREWHFDLERVADPMPEEFFDLNEWLKWGLRPKRGRPQKSDNEPVWFSRDDRNGLELREYIRFNHPHLVKALERISRTLRVASEEPEVVVNW